MREVSWATTNGDTQILYILPYLVCIETQMLPWQLVNQTLQREAVGREEGRQ